MIRNLAIGLAVSLAVALGIGFIEGLSGTSTSSTTFILPMVLGGFTFFILQMRSGNRKEVRIGESERRAALSDVAPAGHALLYVYRDGFVGKLVGWNVSLNGAALAQLRSPRFTQVVLGPGTHTLAVSLSGLAGSQNKPAQISFEAHSGEVIVFAMKTQMGALSNTLAFVREPDNQAALRKLAGIPMVAAELPGSVITV